MGGDTDLPLCPKLKSFWRYVACAEAKKKAATSDERGAAKYISALYSSKPKILKLKK